ncbi:MAG: ABC transporter permease subunit, partial [Actinobacteria bacterium]|nr:ABC transporter permease subunit [Actinomycetota bacterium]
MRSGRGTIRYPWILLALTWAYLIWYFLPLLLAIRTSFTLQPLANGSPAGWSLDQYRTVFRNPDSFTMLWRSGRMALTTVVIALPLGTMAALAIRHWVHLTTRAITLLVLFAIALPQILLGSSLFLFFVSMGLKVGPTAQMIGHITVAIPFVTLIVWTGGLAVDPEQEQAAGDLGASPMQIIRRVTLPLMTPSMIAAASVAFVISYDNFVISQSLCIETIRCETVPMSLFGRGGVPNPGAPAYALATLALLGLLITIGVMVPLWNLARRQTSARIGFTNS